MKQSQKLIAKEREQFSYDEWNEKFLRAQTYRITCGWESKAEDAIRIRKNDLPLGPIKAMQDYKGKHYVDNWVWKGIKMLVSMLAGAAVDLDVKSYNDADSGSGVLVETELNWASNQFKLQESTEPCLLERYYPGMGWIRGIWNSRRVTPNYQTGIPIFESIPALNVWIDPGTSRIDRSDMRYLFHQEWFDVAELKRQYPKIADKIAVQSDPDKSVWTDQVRIVTIQYRRTFTTDIVIIEDQHTGVKKEFGLEEWTELVMEAEGDPEAAALWQEQMMGAQEAGQPILEFEEWLVQGGFLPEQVLMHGPIESEKDAVFQAIILPDQSMVIQEPQYVGETFTYFCLPGINDPDCAYAEGLASRQADTLEEDIILQTSLILQVVKMHRNKELQQEGALVNEEEYRKHGHELNVNPIVRETWQSEHEGTDAVKPLPLPDIPRAAMMLSDRLIQNQKTTSGAVDALMGMQTSSGQSGIQVAQLQTAARTYLRDDIESYRRFIQQIATWLMNQIIRYRNYPHQIPGLREDQTRGLIDVATDITNRLDTDDFYCEVTLQDNEEVVKQIEREFYQYLVERQFITPLSFMRKMDIPNPEKEIQDMQEWAGERQLVEILRSVPGAQEYLMQYAQNYAATNAQQGNAGGEKPVAQ